MNIPIASDKCVKGKTTVASNLASSPVSVFFLKLSTHRFQSPYMCGAKAKMLNTLSIFWAGDGYTRTLQMKNVHRKWCSHIIFPENLLRVEASMRLMKDMIKLN